MNDGATGTIGHEKIKSIQSGNIVVSVWEKKVDPTKVYYDISISRQYFYEDDEPKYSSKIQQRDFDDLILAVTEARLYIKQKVYELRKNNFGS